MAGWSSLETGLVEISVDFFAQLGDFVAQRGKIRLNSLPEYFEVHLVVAV